MGRGGRGNGSGSGRRPLSSSFDRELRGHIESCKNKYLSVEDLVNHLRSSYHKYSREKLLPFTKWVQDVLQTSIPNSTEDVTPPSKKPKRDSSEQRLQLLEKKHIMNSQRKKQESGDGSSSTTLASTSESDDSYSSSSSDAIYGEKLEEKPDLMKSMLRHTYNQQVNNTPKSKRIEYEVVHDNNDEKRKKLDMSKGGQRRNGATWDLGGGGGVREGERFGDSDGMLMGQGLRI